MTAVLVALAMVTAARAGAGWYLMVPLPTSAPFRPGSMPPFSQWEQSGAYGSAGECEAEIFRIDAAAPWKTYPVQEYRVLFHRQHLSARCIASDDRG